MAYVGALRLWDETPQITRNFVFETKLVDFGNMYSDKSILGFTLSVTQNSTSNIWELNLDYRQGLQDNYISLGYMTGLDDGTTDTNLTFNFKKMFPQPIKNIKNLQLKISSSYISGNFGINDIGIIYREYRDSTTNRFDE